MRFDIPYTRDNIPILREEFMKLPQETEKQREVAIHFLRQVKYGFVGAGHLDLWRIFFNYGPAPWYDHVTRTVYNCMKTLDTMNDERVLREVNCARWVQKEVA